MRQLLASSLILFWCSTVWSAELLVQAVDSPFAKGGKKGDVIVVRPDGWEWGKEECLPRYIVVKLPGVKEVDAKKYEEQLTETKDVPFSITLVPVDKTLMNTGFSSEEELIDKALTTAIDLNDATKTMTEKITNYYASEGKTVASVVDEGIVPIGKDSDGKEITAASYVVTGTASKTDLVRLRKYSVGAAQVDSVKFTATSELAVESKDVDAYVKDTIAVKDLAIEKAAISAEAIK